MPREPGTGSFYKDKKRNLWVGAVTVSSVGGKQRRRTVSAKDRGAAMRKWRDLKAQAADRIVVSSDMKVDAWLDYWLETVRGPYVRPKTKEFYANAIRLHIKPAIGHRWLTSLTPAHVRTMLADIKSTSARQRAHLVLRLALKSAIIEGLIDRNVTDAVPRPRHVAKTLGAFTTDTAAHIIATAFATREESEATRWAAAFLTGARQGELLGLRWSHVDLELGIIALEWQLQQLDQEHGCLETVQGHHRSSVPESEARRRLIPARQAYPCGRIKPGYCPQRRWAVPDGFDFTPLHGSLALTRPKSRAGIRIVPVVAPLWAALKHLQLTAPDNDYDLVWTQSDGKPIQPRADHRAWQQLLADAGVPATPLHAARHSTSTILQANGVDEDTRMRIAGHSSAAAHRGYIHVSQEQARTALETLSALMPGSVDG